MFDDIWKEAILKAAPIMILVIIFSTIALIPAYLMTGILVKQQSQQQIDLARQVH
tara:strand:+ start:211 stop:375 length:165 start_codon:yes stop_codon:yes gene_type:complete